MAEWINPRTCPFTEDEMRAALAQIGLPPDEQNFAEDLPSGAYVTPSHYVLALLAQVSPALRDRVREHLLRPEWSAGAYANVLGMKRDEIARAIRGGRAEWHKAQRQVKAEIAAARA